MKRDQKHITCIQCYCDLLRLMLIWPSWRNLLDAHGKLGEDSASCRTDVLLPFRYKYVVFTEPFVQFYAACGFGYFLAQLIININSVDAC